MSIGRSLALVALLGIAAGQAHAQAADSTAATPRPHLELGADSNSARANFIYGMQVVDAHPDEAVRAFYWASRLDPSSGDALYALRSAKLLAMDQKTLAATLDRSPKKERTPEQLALDSLAYRAYAMNPFVFGSLDVAVRQRSYEAQIRAAYPKMDTAPVRRSVWTQMHTRGSYAWRMFNSGEFQKAVDAYAHELQELAGDTIPKHKGKSDKKDQAFQKIAGQMRSFAAAMIHAERGRAFFLMDSTDSASHEMSQAIETLTKQDEKDPLMFYVSKAMFDQSLGIIYERAHQPDSARRAYEAALQEDLSFYSAHARIALLEIAAGDTAGALTEMDLALQLAPNDAALRFRYGRLLVNARRDNEAVPQLRRAIALDPYYGAPHLMLARIADVENYTDEAIAEYKQYLGVASRVEPELLIVRKRLAKLTSTVASTSVTP